MDSSVEIAFFDSAGIKIRTEINGHVATLHGVAREVLACSHLANHVRLRRGRIRAHVDPLHLVCGITICQRHEKTVIIVFTSQAIGSEGVIGFKDHRFDG